MLSLTSDGWFSYVFLSSLIVGSFFYLYLWDSYSLILGMLPLERICGCFCWKPQEATNLGSHGPIPGPDFIQESRSVFLPSGFQRARSRLTDPQVHGYMGICLRTILVFLTSSLLTTSHLSFCSRFVFVFSGGGGWVLEGLEISLLQI